jgi:hypothetical protein
MSDLLSKLQAGEQTTEIDTSQSQIITHGSRTITTRYEDDRDAITL